MTKMGFTEHRDVMGMVLPAIFVLFYFNKIMMGLYKKMKDWFVP